jgi:hypothetical protein
MYGYGSYGHMSYASIPLFFTVAGPATTTHFFTLLGVGG